MSAFWAMGGYALYVWPAYAMFILVLAWDWVTPSLRRRRLARELGGKLARERARRERATPSEIST